MATELTKSNWGKILKNPNITNELNIKIFQTLYSFENYKASSSQVGRILGYEGKNTAGSINLEIGRYAKRIAKDYDINFTERESRKYKFWDLFFNGWDEDKKFVWQLKKNLVKALEETELTGEEQFAEEIPKENIEILHEGIKKIIIVNTFERNSKARNECIKHWGTTCGVCNFNFEEKFGEIGKKFIHVHHLTPISEIGEKYEVDPINDLRPVCPNCHAMLHKKNPPYRIEELQQIIGEQKSLNEKSLTTNL